MEDTTAQLLLQEFRSFRDSEFREFREEVQAWKVETAERLTQLEASAHDLCGNGQPGRMAGAESRISGLEQLRWGVVGAAAAISALITLACRWLPWLKK